MVFEFATSGIGRIIAGSGADFAIFDMEHSGWSTETVKSLVTSCGGTDLVPMARVPATEYHLIARVLDIGAMGARRLQPWRRRREGPDRKCGGAADRPD